MKTTTMVFLIVGLACLGAAAVFAILAIKEIRREGRIEDRWRR